ncbi:MAG: hypothetical protein RLZZ405_689 [Verrucomicrobiota bacterium]|jgi:uncharacterized membrane protein YgdD (TMEM256/DUF423 family)
MLGTTAVALGAFGAHGLKERLAAIPEAAGWWQTATFYLLTHAVAVGALRAGAPGWFWAGGAAVFSGTLYALALGAPRWLGAVTPVGGGLLLAGWVLLAWNSARSDARSA